MKKIALLVGCVLSMLAFSSSSVNIDDPKETADYSATCDKVIDRAIKAGREKGGLGYYKAVFNKKENVSREDVLQYMVNKDYFVEENSLVTGNYLRFGYPKERVESINFVMRNEWEMMFLGIHSGTQLVKGKVVCIPDLANPRSGVKEREIMWTGNIKDGKICGKGIGFTKLVPESAFFYVVKGVFDNGVAVGHCEYITYSVTRNDYNGDSRYSCVLSCKKNGSDVIEGRPFHNGYASVRDKSGLFGFMNSYGELAVPFKYDVVYSDFCAEGYAIVKNTKGENKEVKVNGRGEEIGYSDTQLAIDENARQAQLAYERRLAEERRQKEEEKRLKELKENESKKFEAARDLYLAFQDERFLVARKEYNTIYPEGQYSKKLDSMVVEMQLRYKLMKERENVKDWRTGYQVCKVTNTGVILGTIEKFNEDRSAVQIRVNAAPAGSYSGQRLTEGEVLWARENEGWHLALTEEIVYARDHSSARSIHDPTIIQIDNCRSCNGRGEIPCYLCDGTGYTRDYHGYRVVCGSCNGKGSYRCSSCNGSGRY